MILTVLDEEKKDKEEGGTRRKEEGGTRRMKK